MRKQTRSRRNQQQIQWAFAGVRLRIVGLKFASNIAYVVFHAFDSLFKFSDLLFDPFCVVTNPSEVRLSINQKGYCCEREKGKKLWSVSSDQPPDRRY